ncbi:MAG: hypothetical protein AAGH79_02305, partial [Bacteroidota bacterium]
NINMDNTPDTLNNFCIFRGNICLPLADYHQITYIDLKKQTLHNKIAFPTDLPSEDQPKTMLSIPTYPPLYHQLATAPPLAVGPICSNQNLKAE